MWKVKYLTYNAFWQTSYISLAQDIEAIAKALSELGHVSMYRTQRKPNG